MDKLNMKLIWRWSVVLLFFLAFLPGAARSDSETVLYERDSQYHHIRVSEQNGCRYLSFNRRRGSQSAVNVENPNELQFAYTKASFVAPAFLDRDPQKILLVGLGGASIPRVMGKLYPKARIDVVEIDPDVVMVAKKYFFFEPAVAMRVFTQDGRMFLRRNKDQYDLIFLDAYNDHAIPFHLTTKEFFEIVKERLAPGGIVVSNIWGPKSDGFYRSEIKTLQQAFTHLYFIDSIATNNYIIVATSYEKSMTLDELLKRVEPIKEQFDFTFSLDTYARTFEDISKETIDAEILLDDFAPVEVLRSRGD